MYVFIITDQSVPLTSTDAMVETIEELNNEQLGKRKRKHDEEEETHT